MVPVTQQGGPRLEPDRAAQDHAESSGARAWQAERGLLLPSVAPSPLAGKTAQEIQALYTEQFRAGLYSLSNLSQSVGV